MKNTITFFHFILISAFLLNIFNPFVNAELTSVCSSTGYCQDDCQNPADASLCTVAGSSCLMYCWSRGYYNSQISCTYSAWCPECCRSENEFPLCQCW